MAQVESPLRIGTAVMAQSVDALNEVMGAVNSVNFMFTAVPVASSVTGLSTLQTVNNGAFTLSAASGAAVASSFLGGVTMQYLGIINSNAVTQASSFGAGYARGISVSGVIGSIAAFINVTGIDYWKQPQTERISTTGGAVVTYGRKAFLAVSAATTTAATVNGYSIGTSDVIGFPYRVDYYGQMPTICYSDSNITTSAGFASADASAASSTTGDVRGTYLLPSAANGQKSLFIDITNLNTNNRNATFGVIPA